jgi:hypothetical protein
LLLGKLQRLKLFVRRCGWMHRCGAMHATCGGAPNPWLTVT